MEAGRGGTKGGREGLHNKWKTPASERDGQRGKRKGCKEEEEE